MGINVASCYTVTCDKCTLDLEHEYIPHYPTRGDAEQGAMDEDWVVINGLVWCDRCVPFCECGHGFAAHNYDPCDDCACEGFTPQSTHPDGEGE